MDKIRESLETADAEGRVFLEAALRSGKRVGVPHCYEDSRMEFLEIHALSDLTALSAFGIPEAPFIAGDFVQDWKNASDEMKELSEIVTGAIRNVCEDLPFAAFVSSEGLLSNRQDPTSPDTGGVKQDNIHFCHDAQNTLGKRYFEKFIGLIKRS